VPIVDPGAGHHRERCSARLDGCDEFSHVHFGDRDFFGLSDLVGLLLSRVELDDNCIFRSERNEIVANSDFVGVEAAVTGEDRDTWCNILGR